MLDTINYTKNDDGSFTKTITGIVLDVPGEIYALQQQIDAFQLGDQNDIIVAAIANYKQALTELQ